MKYPIVVVPFLPYAGMALFPFVLVKTQHLKNNSRIIQHEKIHLRQQLEMLLVFFYVIYLLHYIVNLIFLRNHEKAYMNIVFEKEAYAMEIYPDYLQRRRFWAWARF